MFSRRIRIILAGILAVLVVIILVLVLRSPMVPAVSVTASPDVDQIVVTLFAQTAVAKLNVTLNPATVVVNFPNTTPTPIPVFPDEARQALQNWA